MLRAIIFVQALWLAGLLSACGSDDQAQGNPNLNYLLTTSVSTPDGSSTFVASLQTLPSGSLDLRAAREIPGFTSVESFGGNVFIMESMGFTLTRYSIGEGGLVAGPQLNLSDRGFTGAGALFFLNAERAFVLNNAQLEVVEWNPTAMTVTRSFNFSSIQRDDFGYELRGGFFRRSDATLFIYLTYTNMRSSFLNEFKVIVVDTNSGTFEVITDSQCPASAGFGGFFDSAGDLYLIADSFGTFTLLDNTTDPKDNCILRIRPDSRTFDPSYRFRPKQALGGLQPWGLYRAYGDNFYTTAVDPSRLSDFSSVYEFIFARIHEGWMVNLEDQSAQKIENLPADGVGFGGVTVDQTLLIPRTTGQVQVEEIDNVETSVFTLEPGQSQANLQFSMPGYLGRVIRVR